MRRVLGKCSSLALLSCGIFFFIVTILFFWVINLDGQQLKTDNAIDVNAAASSIVSSIRAGSTGSHRIHSSPVSGSSSQHQYNQQVPSWMIVNPYGVQIAVADCADQECLMKLPSAMILLGSAVHPFQVSENVVNLKLFVEHPYEGWVTISSANIQTGVVTHYVRMLNTTIATADVPLENSNYCTNTTNHWIGMDHVGGDLPNQPHGAFSNPVTVNSASDCCVKCSVTLQCVRWTLVGQAECWLKGAAAALKPGDKAKHLTSGTVPAASKQQHSSPTVQGKKSSTAEALVPAHTSSVECCSETAAVLPKLGSSGPDAAVEEVLASLSMPVFDEPCPLGAVCAFSKRAVLSSTLMALLRELLACPVPVLRRTQALQGPATSMLTNPKGARVVLSMLNSKPFSMAEQVRSKNDNHGIRPVLQTNRLTADWTDQQPIGTGRFGALVGGNIRSEVIPLSVAGLFLKHPNIGGRGFSLAYLTGLLDLPVYR